MENTPIILASGSPRRAQLLRQVGVEFAIEPAGIDETPRPCEAPADYVSRMAIEKALAVFSRRTEAVVIGADTSVIVDGRVLGKPASAEQGAAMLRALAGRAHEVLTGVAVRGPKGACETVTCTRVHMRAIADDELSAYWRSGEPTDKAGGYAIQGLGAVFVTHIEGSYSGVVGLPLCETASLLASVGVFCGPMSQVA
jgi:septum formation protein